MFADAEDIDEADEAIDIEDGEVAFEEEVLEEVTVAESADE